MTFEQTLSALISVQLAPLREALYGLTAEVQALRDRLPPSLVSVTEAARALGLSVATVRRRVKDGSLPSCRVGRSRRIDLTLVRPVSYERN
jgi:excisionase family DNA binding protein